VMNLAAVGAGSPPVADGRVPAGGRTWGLGTPLNLGWAAQAVRTTPQPQGVAANPLAGQRGGTPPVVACRRPEHMLGRGAKGWGSGWGGNRPGDGFEFRAVAGRAGHTPLGGEAEGNGPDEVGGRLSGGQSCGQAGRAGGTRRGGMGGFAGKARCCVGGAGLVLADRCRHLPIHNASRYATGHISCHAGEY